MMEVKLIAMTDAVFDYGTYWRGHASNGPIGNSLSLEEVCNHAAKTCTSEDAGNLLEPGYIGDEFTPKWTNGLELGPLREAIRSGHESVLEHAVFTFEVKGVSRALTHQLVRHRIASYSQQSQRYVNMDEFEYVTPDWIEQSWFDDSEGVGNGNWGSGRLKDLYDSEMERLASLYSLMVESGVPEEDARYILPNACTTNIIVTMNARELRHFFSLRCCERAQWEIRELANRMLKICKEVSPIIFEDAGPRCEQLGYCPEAKGCGLMPKKEVDE